MDLGLAGKNVYVTGTAGGIGQQVVRQFAAEGARVFAVDINLSALTTYVADEGLDDVTPYGADLSTLEGCHEAADAAVELFGCGPDVIVNNAGVGRMLPFEELDDDDFHRTFELNFFSMLRTCKRLIPHMLDNGGGAIVNVTSDLASQPETVFADYSPSKAAMVNLSKILARTYAPTIRVNDVSPGPIWTPLWFRPGGYLETLEKNSGLRGEAAIEHLVKDREIPMARLGDPAEVAYAVLFLASPLSAYTTGSSLGVNGGTVRAAF
jgi:NAD(P)-dependent dehydrogenase (short-subunit alcohol dehydrogenase family)